MVAPTLCSCDGMLDLPSSFLAQLTIVLKAEFLSAEMAITAGALVNSTTCFNINSHLSSPHEFHGNRSSLLFAYCKMTTLEF